MLILSTYGILAETSDDSNSDIPKSCIKWYDGCNDCSVVNGKIGSCTEKACLVQNEPKCLEYSNSEIPNNCKVWYDGCNEGIVENGKVVSSTDRACPKYEKAECREYSTEESSDCKLVYDGCNTCLYDENNKPGKCTEKACVKYETPKCLDEVYKTPTKETGPVKITQQAKEDEKYLCSGCELDNKCYPFGYRKSGNFCSDQNYEFMAQTESESQCENNFECSSNLCLSGKCVSPSLMDKILNWFKAMFE